MSVANAYLVGDACCKTTTNGDDRFITVLISPLLRHLPCRSQRAGAQIAVWGSDVAEGRLGAASWDLAMTPDSEPLGQRPDPQHGIRDRVVSRNIALITQPVLSRRSIHTLATPTRPSPSPSFYELISEITVIVPPREDVGSFPLPSGRAGGKIRLRTPTNISTQKLKST